jgi:nucleotide-binding universal stress UspA family protein
MANGSAPVLIAYDGSELSQEAVRHAADLFAGRAAMVVTVWEPGLAAAAAGVPDALGMGSLPPDPATLEAVDRAQHDHAATVSAEGAELGRSLGLAAEAHAVPDEVDVADTLLEIARENGAAVVVMGSHGVSGLRSRVLGSVSRRLIEHGDLPVLIVRERSAR